MYHSILKKKKKKKKRKKNKNKNKNGSKASLTPFLTKGDCSFQVHPPTPQSQNTSLNCLGRVHFQDEILYFAPTASGYQKSHAFLY